MTIRRLPLFALLSLAACGQQQGASTPPAATAYRVYVTNERSGDLTAIDGATRKVILPDPPERIRRCEKSRDLHLGLLREGLEECPASPSSKTSRSSSACASALAG